MKNILLILALTSIVSPGKADHPSRHDSHSPMPPLYFLDISGPTSAYVGNTKSYTASWTDGFGNPISAPPSSNYTWSATGGTVTTQGQTSCSVQWTSAGSGVVELDYYTFGNWYYDYVNVSVVASPVATAATSATASSFTANWNSSPGATSYRLDVSTSSSFSSFVTGYNNISVTGTSKSVTGLSAGTQYYYRIRAVGSAGTSDHSNVITLLTIPAAPTAIAATSYTQTSFTANWNSTSGATAYKLDVALTSAFLQFVSGYQDRTVNSTNESVTGLTAGNTYYVRVRAINGSGASANSNVVTALTIPPAPVATAASLIMPSSFTANWNSAPSANGYYIDIAANSGFSSMVYENLFTSGTYNSIGGLSPSTTYYYRIRAVNGSGTSINSNTISVTTSPPPPAAPTDLSATNVSEGVFTANWSAVATATSYLLDVSDQSNFSSFVSVYHDFSVGGTSQFVGSLSGGTIYYYRVRAVNSSGASAYSNTASVITVPPAPTGIAISNTTAVSFTLGWNSTTGADSYRLDVARDFGLTNFVSGYSNLVVNNTSITVTGLAPGTEYYYKLRAVNTSGTSTDVSGSTITSPASQFPFLKTETVRIPGVNEDADFYTLSNTEKNAAVTYFDGMLRTHQQVAVASSPLGKDVVAPIEYDSYGRVSKNYLPYVASTNDGAFKSSYAADQLAFYNAANDKIVNDTSPFAVTVFENSPLERPLEQGLAGTVWQPGTGHTKRFTYTFNVSGDNVRKFNSDGTSSGFYAANKLYKSEVMDENDYKVITFTDELGRTVLKKVQLDEVINSVTVNYLETYYIYDDFGRMKYTISPKGVAALLANGWSFTQSIKDQYVYENVYDNRGRVIEKKVPGSAWVYYGYDDLNRLVLMQDGLLRSTNQWLFIKYDRKHQPVMQGLYTNTVNVTRASVQTVLDGLYTSSNPTFGINAWFEMKGTALHGYTNTSFPKTNQNGSALTILSANYYDNHDFDNNGSADYSYISQGLTGTSPQQGTVNEGIPGPAFGKATGSKRLVLGTSTWLYMYVFYDTYGRVIQVRSDNHLSATKEDLVTNVYDFEGKLLTRKTYHKASVGKETTVINKYEYDLKGRLINVYQNNNSAPTDQLVVKYEYNELGQLVDKKLHNTTGSNFLQSVDYRYTIRGWMASINNSQLNVNSANNDESTDYFGMELFYNTSAGIGNAIRYNGNITGVRWKGPGLGSGNAGRRSYKYTYDKSDKLKAATFQAYTSAWNVEANAQNESLTYDHNGNIATLQRNQRKHQLIDLTASYISETVDNLTYTYNSTLGDQLTKVQDATSHTAGFNDGEDLTNEYTYDTNGNLTADLNKGISNVTYNFLGKPQQVTFADGKVINYTYDAAGNKLAMSVTKDSNTATTDYAGGFVYENGNLNFFGSPEGRVVKIGSNLEYQYSIADHQGNTRVVFSSVTPAPAAPNATFEGDSGDGSSAYTVDPNFVVTFVGANHTPGGSKVVKMNQTYKIGPSKSLKVFPGDKVDIEVWEYHEGSSGFGTSSTPFNTLITMVAGAFGGVSGGPGESGMIYNGVNSAIDAFEPGGNQGDTRPAAYLNYILFDEGYNVLDMGWLEAPDVTFTKQKISFNTLNIKEEGHVFVYLSYDDDSNNWVYFDDMKVTHTKTNVIQYNEYYPFGLQTSNSWTREDNNNNFLYNAANELNQNSGWYEMFFRGYDPALGRMLQVDPYAASFASQTPYNYSLNDPVLVNDPSGGYAFTGHGPNGWFLSMSAAEFWGTGTEYLDNGNGGGRRGSRPGNWDWADQFGGQNRDFHLMNMYDFEAKYGVSVTDYMGQWKYERALGASTPYSGDYWILGSYGSSDRRYSIVNGSVVGYTTYAISANGGLGEETYYQAEQNAGFGVPEGLGSAELAIAGLKPTFDAAAYFGRLQGGAGEVPLYLKKNLFKSHLVRGNNALYIGRVSSTTAIRTANILSRAAPTIGALGAATNVIDIVQDGQLTAGDGFQAVNTGLMIAFPVYGVLYGVVDLGFAVFSDQSLTDRIKSGIDSNVQGSISLKY